MGGSKQGYFGTTRGIDPVRLRTAAEEATASEELESNINDRLRAVLAEAVESDPEERRERLDAAKRALGDTLETTVDTLLGGSLAKRTYVEGLSDVDSLAVLRDSELARQSPSEVLTRFETALRQRLPLSEVDRIERGRLAVTIHYRDGSQIQLLPAVREGDAVAIAAPDGRSWSRINPRAFASKLTEVNQQHGGRVLPVVRLAKRIVAGLPAARRPDGYHLESLAIESFQRYDGPRTYRDMVLRFFDDASRRVLRPIVDHTGQSVHVDDDLGPASSVPRRLLADSLSRIHRRLAGATTIEQWNQLLTPPEPDRE